MQPSLNNEQSLINRLKRGDEEALQQLITSYLPRLYRVVHRFMGDDAEAESILQETFWKFWKSLPKYQNDRPIYPYLVTIAVNLVRDLWRSEYRFAASDVGIEMEMITDPAPLPECQAERAELLQTLAEVVAGLPETWRMTIALRYDANLSYEEIAGILKININTVRTHLHRSKEIMRSRIEEAFG